MFDPWPALAPFGITLDGLFYYDTFGRSEASFRTVILVHGLGDEADSWRHLVPLLSAAGNRVLALDLPGFGRSKGKSSWIGHRDAVCSLIDMAALTGTGQITLIGSSMGAVVAETAALERPDAVEALVFVDGCLPTGSPPPKSLSLLALPLLGRKWYRKFRTDHEGVWKSLYPYYADLDALPEDDKVFLRKRVIDRVTSPSQESAYFSTLRSMLGLWRNKSRDLGERLAAWPGKTLLVWGETDRVFLKSHGEYFCSIVDNEGVKTKLEVISGAGHLPHQEKPEKTAEIILKFLESLDDRDGWEQHGR